MLAVTISGSVRRVSLNPIHSNAVQWRPWKWVCGLVLSLLLGRRSRNNCHPPQTQQQRDARMLGALWGTAGCWGLCLWQRVAWTHHWQGIAWCLGSCVVTIFTCHYSSSSRICNPRRNSEHCVYYKVWRGIRWLRYVCLWSLTTGDSSLVIWELFCVIRVFVYNDCSLFEVFKRCCSQCSRINTACHPSAFISFSCIHEVNVVGTNDNLSESFQLL